MNCRMVMCAGSIKAGRRMTRLLYLGHIGKLAGTQLSPERKAGCQRPIYIGHTLIKTVLLRIERMICLRPRCRYLLTNNLLSRYVRDTSINVIEGAKYAYGI